MRFEFHREPDGRAGVRVDRFDADDGRVGNPWLWIDSPLADPTPDMAAAAAALAFGNLVGSVFDPPWGMSSHMAEAVFVYLGKRHLRPVRVSNDAVRSRGAQTLRLHSGQAVDHQAPGVDALNLHLVAGDMHYGQQASRGALAIPSNSQFFAAHLGLQDAWRVDVAGALLAASRLDVGHVRLVGYGVSPKELLPAARLALSAGVRLDAEGI
ncbi:hypothetical protein GCM10027063_33170 [Promicromonospora xylanilytica]